MATEKSSHNIVSSPSSLGEELLRRRRHRRLKGFGEDLELIPPPTRNERQSDPSTDGEFANSTASCDSGQKTVPSLKLQLTTEPYTAKDNGFQETSGRTEKNKLPTGGFRRLFRKFSVFVGVLLVIIGIICYRTLFSAEPRPLLETNNSVDRSMASGRGTRQGSVEESDVTKKIMLHISGAVKNPGMLEVVQGTRVGEALQKAGGHTPDASLESINLASVVQDGEKIHIPKVGEERHAISDPNGRESDSSIGSKEGQKININTASETELMNLPRVGPSTAARIVEHRRKNGSFKSIEDLSQVSGIGPKTLEGLLPLITV